MFYLFSVFTQGIVWENTILDTPINWQCKACSQILPVSKCLHEK